MDNFPAGCIVTDTEGQISAANRYMRTQLGFADDTLIGTNIRSIFSHVSQQLVENLIFPVLRETEVCEEVLLTLDGKAGQRTPVVVNAQIQRNTQDHIHWVLTRAEKRQQLHQALLLSRDAMENRANRLGELAATDELTGLNNRREFLKRSRLVFRNASLKGGDLAIIMADIDHFKKVNDTFGHDEGDAVLRQLSKKFLDVCGADDVVARYGGDEFVFCLPNLAPSTLRQFARRLLKVATTVQTKAYPFTVSFGVCSHIGGNDTALLAAIRDADAALYAAKKAGRNCVFISESGAFCQLF